MNWVRSMLSLELKPSETQITSGSGSTDSRDIILTDGADYMSLIKIHKH